VFSSKAPRAAPSQKVELMVKSMPAKTRRDQFANRGIDSNYQ
jgi:hypothetical protein